MWNVCKERKPSQFAAQYYWNVVQIQKCKTRREWNCRRAAVNCGLALSATIGLQWCLLL